MASSTSFSSLDRSVVIVRGNPSSNPSAKGRPFPSSIRKITELLSYCPAAAEWADDFGHYPLYYALLFGSPALSNLLLDASSARVIGKVRDRINAEPFAKEWIDWRSYYELNDLIYTNLDEVARTIGGGSYKDAQKKQKGELIKELDTLRQAKQIPVKGIDDKIYYAHHDGHGYHHLAAGKLAFANFIANEDAFIAATKSGAAQFFPTYCATQKEYDNLVSVCVTKWVEKGADRGFPYLEASRPIGGDKGEEATWIEIYGAMDSLGAHIRPKAEKYLKKKPKGAV